MTDDAKGAQGRGVFVWRSGIFGTKFVPGISRI